MDNNPDTQHHTVYLYYVGFSLNTHVSKSVFSGRFDPETYVAKMADAKFVGVEDLAEIRDVEDRMLFAMRADEELDHVN